MRKKPAPINTWGLTHIYTVLREEDEAFRWLEAAYKERQSSLPWLAGNSAYAPLRDDLRFQDLVRHMKLPE